MPTPPIRPPLAYPARPKHLAEAERQRPVLSAEDRELERALSRLDQELRERGPRQGGEGIALMAGVGRRPVRASAPIEAAEPPEERTARRREKVGL
jgi:hypothetical protein